MTFVGSELEVNDTGESYRCNLASLRSNTLIRSSTILPNFKRIQDVGAKGYDPREKQTAKLNVAPDLRLGDMLDGTKWRLPKLNSVAHSLVAFG